MMIWTKGKKVFKNISSTMFFWFNVMNRSYRVKPAYSAFVFVSSSRCIFTKSKTFSSGARYFSSPRFSTTLHRASFASFYLFWCGGKLIVTNWAPCNYLFKAWVIRASIVFVSAFNAAYRSALHIAWTARKRVSTYFATFYNRFFKFIRPTIMTGYPCFFTRNFGFTTTLAYAHNFPLYLCVRSI